MVLKLTKTKVFSALLLVAALALAGVFFPWKALVERKIVETLSQRGFQNVHLTVSDLGFHGIVLKDVKLSSGNIGIAVANAGLQGSFGGSYKEWGGKWQVKDITITEASSALPVLAGEGDLHLQQGNILFTGSLSSADQKYMSKFNGEYTAEQPERSKLVIMQAALPWSEGVLSIHNVEVPLAGGKPVRVKIEVKHVSVNALMQLFTGSQASATGVVSGVFPVTVMPDNTVVPGEGSLSAEEPGVIAISPDAIPGDNEQVTLLRDIMKDFHYTHLSMGMSGDKSTKLSLLLALEGQNPKVYNGRQVKLNVHLNGDLVNFVQQSITTFTNPEKFLK